MESQCLLQAFTSAYVLPSCYPISSARPASIGTRARSVVVARAKKDNTKQEAVSVTREEEVKEKTVFSKNDEEEEEYEEVEVPWIQEKAEDLYQITGTAVNSIPGPRVGNTSLPWLLAVPVGYLGITFIVAVVKTILKYNSPKAQRRRLVDKNAFLCKSINDYFPSRRFDLDSKEFKQLESETSYNAQEVLRKYLRYALNERPFNPDLVADLIHLRKVSGLEDSEVAEVLNDISRRIVKEKGPVLMDTRGLTEKGVKRKAAVQALFSKLLYLSELDEFCSTTSRDLLKLKEIFGVTDEDANVIRIETLSGVADMESLEKMVSPDSTDSDKGDLDQ